MEPAPIITVQISSSTGTRYLEVLPDSGADISAAGQEVLELLGQHIDNILPSGINPRTVNGMSMIPLGKVPVTIKLGKTTYKDDLHIYPGVSGALISWKAAKGLGILSASYLYPENQPDKDEQLNQIIVIHYSMSPVININDVHTLPNKMAASYPGSREIYTYVY